MPRTVLAVSTLLALALHGPAPELALDECAAFEARIRAVYDFRPSKLDDARRKVKAQEMDEVWNAVREKRATLLPCLKQALAWKDADAWFCIDGSALLVSLDPTPESQAIQLAHWTPADWNDIDPEAWMGTMTQLASAGLDASAAGKRWLDDDSGKFDVARHALEVGRRNGAYFLFGSLEERFATPALARLAADEKQKGSEVALELLSMQATPEALKALAQLDLATFPAKSRTAVAPLLEQPSLVERLGASAEVTREKAVAALRAFVGGDSGPLLEIETSDEHWAGRLAGVLRDEDLALLREVRRKRMTVLSDEALDDYAEYSRILMTRVWKPDLVK